MGWLSNRLPAVWAVWLANELSARWVLSVVGLERGASAGRPGIRHAHRGLPSDDHGGFVAVMIGVDPHKGSHTAVAIDEDEQSLGEVNVRASTRQVERLLDWAAP